MATIVLEVQVQVQPATKFLNIPENKHEELGKQIMEQVAWILGGYCAGKNHSKALRDGSKREMRLEGIEIFPARVHLREVWDS